VTLDASHETVPKKKRGFALPIVFLVLLLVGIALIGVADTMVVAAQSAQGRAHTQKMFYACEGVARLAVGLTRELSLDDPNLDTVDLNVELEPVRRVALEHGIDLSPPLRAPEETALIEEGALAGLEVLSNAIGFGMVTPSAGGGCNINISQPLGKISPLQFFAFSVDGGEIDTATTGFAANPDFTWGRTTITAPRQINDQLTETNELDAPLRLPAPAIGEALGGVRSRTFRPYIEPPFTGNPDSTTERASSRFAYQADIRIIDGEWYLRDTTNPSAWPGIPIWGDHPCANHNAPEKTCAAAFNNKSLAGHYTNTATPLRRLYSAYERIDRGILTNPAPRGVVSYGKLLNGEPALLAASPHCPGTAGQLRGVSTCTGNQAESVVYAARETFADGESGAAILPINIDVGLLGAALATVVNEELGTKVCMPGGTCTRPFNGMVYVTSTKGVPPTGASGALPYALCGGGGDDVTVDHGIEAVGQAIQACDTAVRYNAVRLHNAASLAAFNQTGITIATDLPVYVYGDWNRFSPNVRSLIMGDRVTVLTNGWRDDGTSPGTGNVEIAGSVLAGWAAGAASRKFNDFLRATENGVHIRVTGSLVPGFVSTRVGAGRSGTKIQSWTHPFFLTSPTSDMQPPGVPRVSVGLPAEVVDSPFGAGAGGCGGG
jgi:hypothetical protein